MQVVEVGKAEYDAHFASDNSAFHSAAFAELNAHRCTEFRCLLFRDEKIRAGLIVGRKGTNWYSPFSAPFGGFAVKNNQQPSMLQIDSIVEALIAYMLRIDAESVQLTFPPLFYQTNVLTKVEHACIRQGFTVTDWDLNYYFDTTGITNTFPMDVFSRSAKHNYKLALQHPFVFEQVEGEDGLRKAYEVIQKNRESKGYYLSMSEVDLVNTAKIIQTEQFLLHLNGAIVASAILYRHSSELVQVVYWGDLPEFKSEKPMFLLTANLFKHYAKQGTRMVDVGPAMLGNMPIYGLCDFKESIGCGIQPKLTLVWNRA